MKVNEIITTSNKVLNTTYSLYTESENDNTNVRCKAKATKCMAILKELNSVMKLLISYLLKYFDNHKLVLKNHKNRELIFKTQDTKSIENILLTRKATFLMKESSLLRKKIKKSLIAADDLSITISYTD